MAVQARLPLAGDAEASAVQVVPPSRLRSTRTVVPAARLLDHEIVRAVPIAQLAPAAGDVTASVAVVIWKAAPTWLAASAPVVATRTRAAAVSGPVAVQRKLPVLGAEAASSPKVAPPSRLSSIDTGSLSERLCVQLIVTGVPTYATASAAGPVTVSDGVAIANVPLLPLADAGLLAATRTTTALESGPVAIQAKLPVLGAAAARISNVLPPSRLSSMLTEDAGKFVDHVIATGSPA